MFFFKKIKYEVTGLNFDKVLKALRKEDIEVYNFEKLNFNKFIIEINLNKKEKLLKILQNLNFKIEEKDLNVLSKINSKQKFKKNFLFIFAIIFFCLNIIYFSNLVFKIEVLGLEKINESQILEILEKHDIKKGNFKYTYDCTKIENLIKNSIDNVSLVSVSFYGNSLLININEKIDNSDVIYDYKPIVAEFDMLIKEFTLISGTSVVKEGDIVKKGDVLVYPYINYKDGTELKVEAKAQIKVEVQLQNTLIYHENHEEYVLSGKTFCLNQLTIFNKPFIGRNFYNYSNTEMVFDNTNNLIPFLNFKVSKIDYIPFQNFLLPIKKETLIFSELVKRNVYKQYSKEIELNLIDENKTLLYNEIVENSKEVENMEYNTITYNENNVFYITTELRCEIKI